MELKLCISSSMKPGRFDPEKLVDRTMSFVYILVCFQTSHLWSPGKYCSWWKHLKYLTIFMKSHLTGSATNHLRNLWNILFEFKVHKIGFQFFFFKSTMNGNSNDFSWTFSDTNNVLAHADSGDVRSLLPIIFSGLSPGNKYSITILTDANETHTKIIYTSK